jgi:hypothetical protein
MSNFRARLRSLFSRENLPRSRFARIALGTAFVLLGLVGFLPVLGFWMVPLGLAILSVDVPVVRRFSRRARVTIGRWWKRRRRKHRQPTPPSAFIRSHSRERARSGR